VKWLILSLKWSASSDELVWYKPDANGYTTDVHQAGRFDDEEAKRHKLSDVTLAVPEIAVMLEAKAVLLVPSERAVVERLRKAAS
jgi:hypothetical protein